jgi:hypothetical protein
MRRSVTIGILSLGSTILCPAVAVAQKVLIGTPAGLILTQVKPDRADDFEAALVALRDALSKSNNPVRKQQAGGWKFYRAAEPLSGNALFVFLLDPAVPNADYSLESIVNGELPKEDAGRLMRRFAQGIATKQNLIRLTPTGTPAPPPAPPPNK